MKRSLGLVDIVLMSVVAVTSLRWIAAAASNGPASLVLWGLAAALFFIPQALAVATLSASYPDDGGLYRWTQKAFGERHGFLCGWCYWVNNLLYFPSLLLFVSANVAFVLQRVQPDSHLEDNKQLIVGVTLGALWLVAALTTIGMRAGKWLQNVGAVGNWLPGLAIALLGVVAFVRFGSATAFTSSSLIPRLDDPGQLTFFSQMCFAFAGFELLAFFGGETRNARTTLTRGILGSSVIVFMIYAAGTLGVLVSVPPERINLVNGILVPIEEAGSRFALGWLVIPCGILLALGGIGQTMAWFAGAARVPYVVGVDRHLPKSFGKLHPRWQTPYVAVLWQASIATIFTLFATAGANTKTQGAYQLMVDMCLILYFIPYCYLFLSLLKLMPVRNRKSEEGDVPFRIPGGRIGVSLVGLSGLATTMLAIGTSIATPGQPFSTLALIKVSGGTAVMIGLGFVFYWRLPARLKQGIGALYHRSITPAS